MSSPLDVRPLIVVLAGSNGAGKTTFHEAHLARAGLRFVNADVLAMKLAADPSVAASLADALRRQLVSQRVSFVFETVFSDPAGDKLEFLRDAVRTGYCVVLCFIAISGPDVSSDRVAQRVLQGGHDVPTEKLIERFPRTIANLRSAIRDLPHVWIFDNDDLAAPFRRVVVYEEGLRVYAGAPLPAWLDRMLP